jgi:hypothetical protein
LNELLRNRKWKFIPVVLPQFISHLRLIEQRPQSNSRRDEMVRWVMLCPVGEQLIAEKYRQIRKRARAHKSVSYDHLSQRQRERIVDGASLEIAAVELALLEHNSRCPICSAIEKPPKP